MVKDTTVSSRSQTLFGNEPELVLQKVFERSFGVRRFIAALSAKAAMNRRTPRATIHRRCQKPFRRTTLLHLSGVSVWSV